MSPTADRDNQWLAYRWSSKPHKGLAACSAKGVPSFLSYFETLSLHPAPEIEPTTSWFCSPALDCLTELILPQLAYNKLNNTINWKLYSRVTVHAALDLFFFLLWRLSSLLYNTKCLFSHNHQHFLWHWQCMPLNGSLQERSPVNLNK